MLILFLHCWFKDGKDISPVKNLASAIRFFRGRPIEDTAQCGVIMGKTCWLKQMPKADTADE